MDRRKRTLPQLQMIAMHTEGSFIKYSLRSSNECGRLTLTVSLLHGLLSRFARLSSFLSLAHTDGPIETRRVADRLAASRGGETGGHWGMRPIFDPCISNLNTIV